MNGLLIILLFASAAAFASAFYGGYPMRNEDTFLVTMTRSEMMDIVTCVADARDPQLCQQYTQCLSMFPQRLVMTYKRCRQSLFGASWPQCFSRGRVFGPLSTRVQIFECVNANSRKETPAEEMAIVQAETCLRNFYSSRCMQQTRHYGYY